MPRLTGDVEVHQLGGTFSFSGARIENLQATEYTLVTIALDVTGSVQGFQDQLREMLISAVESCKKSPRSENLLLRVILFSTQFKQGVEEIHGFTLLSEIEPNVYPELHPDGMTPLYDACYSSIGAMNEYGKRLFDDDYTANAICFVITDGFDNRSVRGPRDVATEQKKAVSGEVLESSVSILIGVNAGDYRDYLDRFQQEAEITQYVDAGEATSGQLAKLARFISQSVSSQSQAIGSGGPSQNISATI